MNKLNEQWELGRLPITEKDINYADGLCFDIIESNCNGRLKLKEFKLDYNALDYLDVDKEDLNLIYNPKTNDVCYWGGGGMGNEGIIIYCNEKNELKWWAWLSFSNPFIDILFYKNFLMAKTEIDYFFLINTVKPDIIGCISFNEYGY